MKKNTIKAFTLVEMLIVIVIIGILIASLMPRMQSAQWRARDVARKNDLSQIQTAIITSQTDKWEWPKVAEARTAITVADIRKIRKKYPTEDLCIVLENTKYQYPKILEAITASSSKSSKKSPMRKNKMQPGFSFLIS